MWLNAIKACKVKIEPMLRVLVCVSLGSADFPQRISDMMQVTRARRLPIRWRGTLFVLELISTDHFASVSVSL